MNIESILTLALAVAALAIKPGAGMMMVMSRSIASGWSACFAFVIGFCVISILFLAIVVFGYQFINVDIVFISIFIKSFAAVYLIWLGIKGLQTANAPLHLQESKAKSFYDNLTASLVLTLSNPLTIVFYAGILPTIMNINEISWNDFIIMGAVICVVELVVAVAYSAPLILFRKRFDQSSLSGLKIFSSIIIILVGLYIGYTAIPAEDLLSVF